MSFRSFRRAGFYKEKGIIDRSHTGKKVSQTKLNIAVTYIEMLSA